MRPNPTNDARDALAARLRQREATAGIIGLGYVGLPLAAAAARGGFRIMGFDIDEAKIAQIAAGRSYIDAVSDDDMAELASAGKLTATTDFGLLSDCDVVVICVPTPLTRHREPDLRFVEGTAREIAARLRPGQLVVLESTTYPGTTEEVLRPMLEAGGLRSGTDFFLGFSPEREDPGNRDFRTATIPKIVAGDGPDAAALAEMFYGAFLERVVPVSSPRVSEAVKITENIFRAVNIALVNELKAVYAAMGIDIWEVIDAAATKPFGFMPFYPGPGLGGHCIPIDPFYLSWKSRENGLPTRFIELAGEINVAMPRYVVSRLEEALDRTQSVSLGAARVLVIGLAYKKNVSDIRESPAFAIIDILESRGTEVDYHDPHVAVIPPTREHSALAGRQSVDLSAVTLGTYHAVVIVTDHDDVDYGLISANARLVVDSRNAMARRGLPLENVAKA